MSYDKVPDAVLEQIANGNGHTYRHEAKSMARELLELRKERASPAPAGQPPFPWGSLP